MIRSAPAIALALVASAGPLLAQDWAGRARAEGTVKNEAGEPVTGARVKLHRPDDPEAGPEPLTTDEKGHWSYLGLTGGDWVVVIEAPGYVPGEGRIQANEYGRPARLNVTLRTSPFSGIEEGNELLEAGKPAEARAAYEKVLPQLEPEQQARLRARIADTYFEEGKLDQAVAAYEQALAALPAEEQLYVHIRLADSHLKQGEFEEARAAYEKALPGLEPKDQARVLVSIAQIQDQQDQRGAAIESLEKAHALDPENPSVIQLLADLLGREGKPKEAESYLAKLPEGTKLPPDMILNLGIEQYNRGNMEAALEHFDHAVEENPDLAEAYYYRGLSYLAQGKNAEAAADLEKFLELAPNAKQAKEAREFLAYLKQGA